MLGLCLAKARGGNVDRESLAANAAQLNLTRWPGPVVAFFLGQIRAEALIAAAKDPDLNTQLERLWQRLLSGRCLSMGDYVTGMSP